MSITILAPIAALLYLAATGLHVLHIFQQRQNLSRTVLGLGLCALLVGGLGVAGAVRGYLGAKVLNIATLKCLGATGKVIFTTYLLQILFLGGLGATAGLACGAALPQRR